MSRSLIYHAFFVLNQIFSFSMNLLLHSVRRCRLPDGCPDCCADAVLHGVADGYGYHPVPVPVLPVTRIARSEERRVGKECRSRWSRWHAVKTMASRDVGQCRTTDEE